MEKTFCVREALLSTISSVTFPLFTITILLDHWVRSAAPDWIPGSVLQVSKHGPCTGARTGNRYMRVLPKFDLVGAVKRITTVGVHPQSVLNSTSSSRPVNYTARRNIVFR